MCDWLKVRTAGIQQSVSGDATFPVRSLHPLIIGIHLNVELLVIHVCFKLVCLDMKHIRCIVSNPKRIKIINKSSNIYINLN